MRRGIIIVLCLSTGLFLAYAFAQAPQGKYSDPAQFHLAKPGVSIAGISEEEALKIYERHAEELRKLPGAVSVSFMAEGLVVETANPAALPAAVEGLPVFAVPPVDPRAAGGLDYAMSNPPKIEPTPLPESPVAIEPPPPECPPGTYLKPGEGRCRNVAPFPQSQEPEVVLVPAPPGFVVLKPGKVREQADKCPEGFEEEVEGHGGWRFCVNPRNPEPIPYLWYPPVAGIPYEEVREIHKRHVEKLAQLPGVEKVGLGADGIHVYTSKPEIVPQQVEGVPIKIFPATGGVIKFLSHSYTNQVRPLHGAIFIGQEQYTRGTLTGIVLSDGHPWMIFPAHLVNICNINPLCPLGLSPLNTCSHYYPQQPGQSVPLVVQPPTGPLTSLVGFVQRWTKLGGSLASNDVAAAYLDSDNVEGNGLLSADRRVESGDNTSIPFSGTPVSLPPLIGSTVTARSALGPPHDVPLKVKTTDLVQSQTDVESCSGQTFFITNQIVYEPVSTMQVWIQPGDSGSPIFDNAGRLVGMMNWCEDNINTTSVPCDCVIPQGQNTCIPKAGGTYAPVIKDTLIFDAWYGTASVPDQTIAVFRPSTGWWTVDNGNGRWAGSCTASGSATVDKCFQYGLGGNVDLPVTGDWDGDLSPWGSSAPLRPITNFS